MMRYDICNKWQFNTIQVEFKFLVSPIEIMRSHIIQFKRLQIIVNLAILAFPMCAEKEAINFLSSSSTTSIVNFLKVIKSRVATER